MATSTTAPAPTTSGKIGQQVFFYADHAHGMKCLDKLEPFAAIVAFPSNSYLGDDGWGFAVRVATLVAPPATLVAPPAAPDGPSAPTTTPTPPTAAPTPTPIMGSPTPIMATPASATPAASAQTAPTTGPIATVGHIEGGNRYRNGSYTNVPLIGGSGTGAEATITVENGEVSSVVVTEPGDGYTVDDTLAAGVNDRLVNLSVIDHTGVLFPISAVPFFHGDDKDDKGAPAHCEVAYRKIEKPAPFAVVLPAPAQAKAA